MFIGEFAKRAGVSTSKIRFYELRGLLPSAARCANGYRTYSEADLKIVTFIDRASSLGFSLAEIARFMERPAAHRRAKVGVVHALEMKLAEMDRHLTDIRRRRNDVLSLLTEVRSSAGAHEVK